MDMGIPLRTQYGGGEVNEFQSSILNEIESLKAERRKIVSKFQNKKHGIIESTKAIDKRLKQLSRDITRDEYMDRLSKTRLSNDPGGRSRSPSFGKWSYEE